MSEERSAPEGAARLASALADRYTIERELGAGGMATHLNVITNFPRFVEEKLRGSKEARHQ